MTSGILFFLAIGALVIAIAVGFVRKKRESERNVAAGDAPK